MGGEVSISGMNAGLSMPAAVIRVIFHDIEMTYHGNNHKIIHILYFLFTCTLNVNLYDVFTVITITTKYFFYIFIFLKFNVA